MIKVVGRELLIPHSERELGFEHDNMVEVREFLVTDKSLFDLSFKLDVSEPCAFIDLEKSISDDNEKMLLTWNISSGITQKSGRLNIQLRAIDTQGTLVWHSEIETFFVRTSIDATNQVENVALLEFKKIELRTTLAKEEAQQQALIAKGYAEESNETAEEIKNLLQDQKEETSVLLEEKANKDHSHKLAHYEPRTEGIDGGMDVSELFDVDGFMSASDKGKLDGIEEGATKTEIVQTTGDSETAVMSQKAVTDEINKHVSDKENPHNLTATQLGVYTKEEVDASLSGKVSKADVVQITGNSETKVMSQKAVTEELNGKADNLILQKMNEIYPDGNGNGTVLGNGGLFNQYIGEYVKVIFTPDSSGTPEELTGQVQEMSEANKYSIVSDSLFEVWVEDNEAMGNHVIHYRCPYWWHGSMTLILLTKIDTVVTKKYVDKQVEATKTEIVQTIGDSETAVMSQKAVTEELNRHRKSTYNLYDKYNADIQPIYIRTSDMLITQQAYARAIVIKRSSSIGETVLFNCFRNLTELGVKDIALFMCSEYPQVGGHALAYDKSYVETAYGRGKPAVTVDCEYLVLQFTWAATTTTTDELMAQMIEELVVVCGSDVGNYEDYPYIDKDILKVEEENLSNEIKEALQGSSPSLNYVETKTVYLGDDVLGSALLGDGWTETDGVFTHATGSDADLRFETAVEENEIYILEFDTSYTANEFVRVGIGNMYRVLCYNGDSKIIVPLLASGGTTLYISPINTTYTGSISNITLRKIQEYGTECQLEIYTTSTNNHTKNYGFWNNFIGWHTAENAVGSTRSIAIGAYTMNALQGGHRNIGIGTFAMSQLIGGEENVSIGADSMLAVKNATACITIGMGGMQEGASRKEDISIGKYTLRGTSASQTEKNIAIGASAGYSVTTAKNNIFIGNNSGYKNTSGFCNTYVGEGAGKAVTTGYFNTFIGRETNAPKSAVNVIAVGNGAIATKSNQAVIGSDAITETLLKGNLIVRATDGAMKQIVFKDDGSVTWTAVE